MRKMPTKTSKGMRRFVLDGHMLNVNFAGRGREMVVEKFANAVGEKGKKRNKTKIVAKNLPFGANKKELWQLFLHVFI
jgi:ribosomal protein S7